MDEMLMILVMVLCVGLFALGGTGLKWARRYVLPVSLGAIALLYAPWWACLGFTVTLCAFLCMGYGERASWAYRASIFVGYGASMLWFGCTLWIVLIPIGCSGLFFLSNYRLTAGIFTWKICEGAMGFLIAAGYISSILNKWR